MRQVGRLEVALAGPFAALAAMADVTASWAPQALQVQQAPRKQCFVLNEHILRLRLCELNSYRAEQALDCVIHS